MSMKNMVKMYKRIKETFKNKYFWYALGVFLFGVLVNQVVSRWMEFKYGNNLPILDDIFFNILPYYNICWVYDLIVIVSTVLFIVYAFCKRTKEVPFFLLMFGFSQLTRGLFIGLTPFGSPKGDGIGLFKSTAFRLGVYPSGHTGSIFLSFLLSKGRWKILFFILTILITTTLLLARGHYSVDIFSALIFNYAIYMFTYKYFRKWLNK